MTFLKLCVFLCHHIPLSKKLKNASAYRVCMELAQINFKVLDKYNKSNHTDDKPSLQYH
jgi:hypothetical protein